MKKFSEIIAENDKKYPEAEKLIEDFGIKFKKVFPNGFYRGSVQNRFGEPFISLSLGLIDNLTDVSSKIRDNDPMFHSIIIHSNNKDGFSSDTNELVPLRGGIYVNPDEGSYLVMKNVKTKLRKAKGSIDKISKHLIKWVDTLKDIVEENKENIYGADKIDKKYL